MKGGDESAPLSFWDDIKRIPSAVRFSNGNEPYLMCGDCMQQAR